MSWVKKIINIKQELRRLILALFSPANLAEEDYRNKLNSAAQQNWPEHPLSVHELIFESSGQDPDATGKFIVFIDTSLEIDWIANATLDINTAELVSYAESISSRKCTHLPEEQVLEFRRMIGQSIVNAIRGNLTQSRELASTAADFLKSRTIEKSRAWTLCTAHVLAPLCAVLIILPIANERPEDWVYCIYGGLTGAYLSIIQKAGKGEWDAASGLSIHAIEVVTKLLAGLLLGVVAYALSRSTHAPTSLKAISPDSASLFLLGVSAGLFERLIPKMISEYIQPSNTSPTSNKQ
jgi:hypothetical protein